MEEARWVFWLSAVIVPSPFVSLPVLLGTGCPVILAIVITTAAETIKVTFYLLGFESLKKVAKLLAPRLTIPNNPAQPRFRKVSKFLFRLRVSARRSKVILKIFLRHLSKNKGGLILVAAFPSMFFVNLGPVKLALVLGCTQSTAKTLIIFFLGDLLFICTYAMVLVWGGNIWASRFV